MRHSRVLVLIPLAALVLTACQVGPQGIPTQFDAAGPGPDAAVPTDAITPVLREKVYAHSSATLFEVDPNDLSVIPVGDFDFPFGQSMTDIALDDRGLMIGITFDRVYTVDKDTAACTHLANLQAGMFNGLSFMEGTGVDPGSPVLVGVNSSGELNVIDPLTGASTYLGNYGGGFGSSGDLVFVRGAGAFATATHSSYSSDVLVSVNPVSGQATLIGEIGYSTIWGLAYWGGEVFGFTDSGQFLTINVTTGQGTLLQGTSHQFWGAGVTTTAPIVD